MGISSEIADIIIIGAGAAGMMAAIGAAGSQSHPKVIILEKMPRPGRKIMISGKGRCNFTNMKDWNEFSRHIHPKPNLLKPSFMNLTSAKMTEFLNANGLETVVERGDRAFPASHIASDIVDTLISALRKNGAELLCGKEVCSIDNRQYCGGKGQDAAKDNIKPAGPGFAISCTDGSRYTCHRLIIATGGLSYPGTGSTGDGLAWAEQLGIKTVPTFPSLTAIVPKGYKTTGRQKPSAKGHIERSTPLSETGQLLNGQSLKNVGLEIRIDGNMVQEEFGDIDFTDGGIEGPIGFKVSRKCVKSIMNGSKAVAIIDLKPAVELQALEDRIKNLWDSISQDRRSQGKPYQFKFKVLLSKLLPMEFIPGFMRCNPEIDHRRLARKLKCWEMEIEGYVGYERCVVTAGGVSADEITAKTLESKKIPGLYIAGELLDLDADTGGYNMQTAFSTGYLAGQSAARSMCQG
ncbi:MAG: aminoacetone oxidase family FAD-binding enzyme [Bacteroidales bacterium]|nr:aminoacetone oxidase family FAD-binding enzyme [Bacteroidales bacterium]